MTHFFLTLFFFFLCDELYHVSGTSFSVVGNAIWFSSFPCLLSSFFGFSSLLVFLYSYSVNTDSVLLTHKFLSVWTWFQTHISHIQLPLDISTWVSYRLLKLTFSKILKKKISLAFHNCSTYLPIFPISISKTSIMPRTFESSMIPLSYSLQKLLLLIGPPPNISQMEPVFIILLKAICLVQAT